MFVPNRYYTCQRLIETSTNSIKQYLDKFLNSPFKKEQQNSESLDALKTMIKQLSVHLEELHQVSDMPKDLGDKLKVLTSMFTKMEELNGAPLRLNVEPQEPSVSPPQ